MPGASMAPPSAADGRVDDLHEGGYNPIYVPFCGLAVIETMAGVSTGVTDPYLASWAGLPGQELQDHQKSLVARVAEGFGL